MSISKLEPIQNLVNELGLHPGVDNLPYELSKGGIIPVIDVKQRLSNVCKSSANATSGTVTLLSVPNEPNKDFYITSAYITTSVTALCDCETSAINITFNGVITSILALYWQPLTAQSNHISISFPFPIKVDKNTLIQSTGTFTAGTLKRVASISGFFV